MFKDLKENNFPIISIIILTRNGLGFTKECVTSIMANTNINYELIIIDNGSSDGTKEYLSELAFPVRTVFNDQNKGFSGGCNQGLSIASGDYFVLLNNDTIVTEDWLTRLVWWLDNDKEIGIVGPRSNSTRYKQLVSPVPYHSVDEMPMFAKKWTSANFKKGFQVNNLSGLCMAFKRELVMKIGGLDERFFPGNFEDTDYCIRTLIAGQKLWVANDVYIHHYGNTTFKVNKEHYKYVFIENKKRFCSKWGLKPAYDINELVKREQPFTPSKHYIPITL
ncbi:glycosyltransferase family 2 protein [Pseudalkalibacillus caeni]|uniref:Glycosyltransferase family 2 protein n=1 Tax=Exobacillus caeni TaxID=2574798 RepID=A0A5R9F552_9BACL|nr:glycosyltransferase family 2 protein [Pseudalkalibacillus caeni]TLS37476.1 glycosyltransferase family 2 protein [Pseudalkalibacillus caeni]